MRNRSEHTPKGAYGPRLPLTPEMENLLLREKKPRGAFTNGAREFAQETTWLRMDDSGEIGSIAAS